MRRLLDITASLLGLIVLAPLFALVAIFVGRPVFYRARRVGRYGREFEMLKFRSMTVAAPGGALTMQNDARVTGVGRVLRRTKVDELPQLINVLRGEMSLVGPRPEDPRYVALYDGEQRHLLDVRPGITSAASLAYRDEERLLTSEQQYLETILPAKLRIDLEYEKSRTLAGDLRLIVRTIFRA
ncbi:MAG TPA: sugar transferase [Thermoanaerobaculia bacterium]|nr:sugar transferase [Thermoanaerobaculia bacterium]